MKSNKAKVLLLTLFTALTVVAVTGCKDKKNESSVSEEVLIQPLTFSYGSNDYNEDATSADGLEGQDPTAAPDTDEPVEYEEVTEYVPVTEANGEPVTTYVTVTDAVGEPATEDSGETQTTAITVTTEIKVTKPVSNQTETTTSTGNEYVPYNDSAYAMWIDISKDEDYVFNDEFIEVVFKIKDNAPDGVYDVKISNPDFASLKDNVKTVRPGKLVNGKVYVNEEAEEQEDVSGEETFVVYTENASGKQGEEVIVRFGMKNNPGLCAINFWFDYDRNAMEIVECSAVGEFGDIANSTSFGNPQG